MKNYAIHYKTGEPIPQELVDKIKKAKNFNGGYAMSEIVEAAILDMMWHTVKSDDEFKPSDDFELAALMSNDVYFPPVPPRYHSPYFLHIWSNGYSAGYYAYLWSEMLDFDAYKWFESHGGMTRENGDRFRKYILSVGNSVDLNKTYEEFTGHKPTIDAMLEEHGLKS
ncbi:MAG: M3 family metallopeptidase [Saprospiraceae bacterium]